MPTWRSFAPSSVCRLGWFWQVPAQLVWEDALPHLHLSRAAAMGSEVSSRQRGDNTLQHLPTLRSEELAQGRRGTPLRSQRFPSSLAGLV